MNDARTCRKLAAALGPAMLGLVFGALLCGAARAEPALSPKWDELTSADFVKALKQAGGLCILPMGSVEKNGPAEPMGTNLYVARILALEAVKQDYAVVFPEYYVAGTLDVSNQQGAIAYSPHLQHEMLEETVSEMARNGCSKILIINGHSGNNGLLADYISSVMYTPHNYVVYYVQGGPPRMSPPTPVSAKLPAAMQPSKPDADGHGGEERTAIIMAYRPELAHPERAHDEPMVAEGALELPLPSGQGGVQTGVSRFKEAPTGYLGDPSGATAARGKALVDYTVARLVAAIKAVKADQESAPLQKKFFEQRAHPGQQ